MRTIQFWLYLIICLAGSIGQLYAQGDTTNVYVHPQVLYPGDNILTISSANGLSSITSTHTANVEVLDDGVVDGCAKTHRIRVKVNTATDDVQLNLRVRDCKGNIRVQQLQEHTRWNLDIMRFPDVEIGDTVCMPFQIRMNRGMVVTRDTIIDGQRTTQMMTVPNPGGGAILDSVSIPEGMNLYLRFPFPPPVTIPSVSTYRYQVCFSANDTGFYKFPVTTWMRREYPVDELTTYPVADTGIVRVVPHRKTLDPIAAKPDTVGKDNPELEDTVTDPTIFRSIGIPNAMIPQKGQFYIGSYDVLGAVAGYAITDEVMLLGGGALPTPDDWAGVNSEMFGAFSIGVKIGTELFDKFNIAAGYQYGQSIFDEEATPDEVDSRITVHAPYGAISYGTDDNRISATFGYAFKRHSTWIVGGPFGLEDFREVFDRNATLLALGGDFRFAKHWKVAAEVAAMETVDVIPAIMSIRYFTNSFAIDLGAAYAGIVVEGAEPPAFPVLPVVSAMFVF